LRAECTARGRGGEGSGRSPFISEEDRRGLWCYGVRMRKRSWTVASCVAILGAALAACGGATTAGASSASASGSVGGASFQVAGEVGIVAIANATSACVGTPDGGSVCTPVHKGQVVGLLLTNRAELTCTYLQDLVGSGHNPNFANLDLLELTVGTENGTVASGTYDIVTATNSVDGARAYFSTTTASCQEGQNVSADKGTITLTEVDGARLKGSYSVTFGTQGAFTGSFDVPVCTMPDAGPAQTTPSPCQP
jgi:hypothetical protein